MTFYLNKQRRNDIFIHNGSKI